jgi:3-aminobutyryl-CoA ammonia-lyase
VQAGDVLEVVATVSRVGRRSRTLEFEARVVCRGRGASGVLSASAAEVLDPPIIATTATGTVVVPAVGMDNE